MHVKLITVVSIVCGGLMFRDFLSLLYLHIHIPYKYVTKEFPS